MFGITQATSQEPSGAPIGDSKSLHLDVDVVRNSLVLSGAFLVATATASASRISTRSRAALEEEALEEQTAGP
jgi:hypothetical protein